MNDVAYLHQRRLHVREVGLTTESVDGLKLREVCSPSECECKSLHRGPGTLEVYVGVVRVEAEGGVVVDVLVDGRLAPVFQRGASGRECFQVSHGDRDVRSLLLEPPDLVDYHRVPEVHPAAGHQTSQHPEGLVPLHAAKHDIKVSVGENDASTM